MNQTLAELANQVQGLVVGDGNTIISGLSPINNVKPHSIVYADGPDNVQLAEASQAAAILVNQQVSMSSKPLLQVKHALKTFIQLIHLFNPPKKRTGSIHPTAVISENVKLGQHVFIGPYVTIGAGSEIADHVIIEGHAHIGEHVQIAENTHIYPHVTIYDHCELGRNVIIHAASVIGSDGFGYHFVDGEHLKMPHVGKVIIEDNVEVGANSVIDKATLGATVIGAGTKIDNLVQIAHSVQLGKNNIVCAFTGIAGSTKSGNNVIFAANVGVSDHVSIENNVILGARAGVPPRKTLKEGLVYLGNPARPKEKAIEQELSVTRIPFMQKNIKALGEKINNLSERIAQYENEE